MWPFPLCSSTIAVFNYIVEIWLLWIEQCGGIKSNTQQMLRTCNCDVTQRRTAGISKGTF